MLLIRNLKLGLSTALCALVLAACGGGGDDVPYDLSSALFTDYALKMRAVYVPAGKQITYTTTGTLDFPVGTAIYKTFYYPKATGTDPKLIPVGKSTTHPQGSTIDLTKHRLIETRIIVREASGKWKVNQWLKKAVLLSFRLNDMSAISGGPGTDLRDGRSRAVHLRRAQPADLPEMPCHRDGWRR